MIEIETVKFVVPQKWKRYKRANQEIKSKNKTRKFIPRNRKRSKSYHLEALQHAKRQIKEVVDCYTIHPYSSGRSRPVIRSVCINDIQYDSEHGYILHYCIFDEVGEVKPISINRYSFEEIFFAYKEAVKIQMKQKIIFF